ncbi:MAG: AAA family ATPase [bacterium]
MISSGEQEYIPKSSSDRIALTPRQHEAAEEVMEALHFATFVAVRSRAGLGRTTVLEWLADKLQAKLLHARLIMDRLLSTETRIKIEECVYGLITDAFRNYKIIVLDDLDTVYSPVISDNPERRLVQEAFLGSLLPLFEKNGAQFIFSTHESVPPQIAGETHIVNIREFGMEDHRHLYQQFLGVDVTKLMDFESLYRFQPRVNCNQIVMMSKHFAKTDRVTAEDFMAYFRQVHLKSNVELDRVDMVSFSSLKGLEEAVEQLEQQVLLPFSETPIQKKYRIEMPRGGLIYGPPGSGKTSIGRALAHRLGGKFFLLEGSKAASAHSLPAALEEVITQARNNAPALLFIDDADLIFRAAGDGEQTLLLRHFLQLLEGVQSPSNAIVTVRMTAVNSSHLPDQLFFRRLIEFELPLRPPQDATRLEIIEEMLLKSPVDLSHETVESLAKETAGLSAGEIVRVIQEGMSLLCWSEMHEKQISPLDAFRHVLTQTKSLRMLHSKDQST